MRESIGLLLASSLLMVGMAPGCGGNVDGGSNAQAFCNRAAAKLRGCGLLSDGEVRCDFDEGVTCRDQCFLAASCSELEQAICSDVVTGDVAVCLDRCVEPQFQCGSGESIDADWKCDGGPDCSDGSDENGCPPEEMFGCGDGTEIPDAWKCDGGEDCSDGSDEVGCPGFVCADGNTIPADWECDGGEDCFDGADEAGCPQQAELVCSGATSGGVGL